MVDIASLKLIGGCLVNVRPFGKLLHTKWHILSCATSCMHETTKYLCYGLSLNYCYLVEKFTMHQKKSSNNIICIKTSVKNVPDTCTCSNFFTHLI